MYRNVCPADDPLCPERDNRMEFIFSTDNTVTIFAGTLLGLSAFEKGWSTMIYGPAHNRIC